MVRLTSLRLRQFKQDENFLKRLLGTGRGSGAESGEDGGLGEFDVEG